MYLTKSIMLIWIVIGMFFAFASGTVGYYLINYKIMNKLEIYKATCRVVQE